MDERAFKPESVAGRPVVGDHGATLCHRGILTIDGGVPAFVAQPTISYTPMGGRVWSASDGIYRTIFLEGDSGVICFDTFHSPGAAIAYRKAVERVFPHKPIHTIVYSHDHLDHTGYSLDLAPGAEVIAHRECADLVALRASDGQKEATEVWEGSRTEYEIDGVRFQLVNPGATHGAGNVAALFEDERLLFMVDTVIPGVGYTFLPDWHMASYLESMRTIEAIDFDVFVPGHFWPVDRAGFRENLDFFDFVLEAGERALQEGVDPHDYGEVVAYAEDRYGASHRHVFRFSEYFAMNLMRAMLHALQGPWGLEDACCVRAAAAPDAAVEDGESKVRPGGLGRPPRTPAGDGVSEIQTTRLADGLWTVSDGHVRTVFALGEEGVVACNTLGSSRAARAYRQAIEEAAPDAPVAALVLTIDHADHAGFALDLDLPGGVDVVAHELCARALDGRGGERQVVPNRLVRGTGEQLELAGVPLELRYPGPTVGTGGLACWFPRQRTIFLAGPRADARYGLFADWHVEHAAASLRRLLELPFETVVPAAGPVMDRAGLVRAIEYLEDLQWTVQKAYAEGIAVWDIRAMEEYANDVLRAKYRDYDGFADHVGIGAIRIVHHYLMGGWGLEDTRRPDVLLDLAAEAR